MNNPSNTLKPLGTQSKETVDLAAAKARDALDSTRTAADRTIDKAADKVDDVKAGTAEAIDKASGTANAVASKAKDQLDKVKSQVRAQTANLSDQVADYTAAEPVKAMLIAAAAGAVLMAVLSMMVRSGD